MIERLLTDRLKGQPFWAGYEALKRYWFFSFTDAMFVG